MKKIILLIISISIFLQISANKTDSLLYVLKNAEVSEQASIYNALAEENLYYNQAKALEYSLKAINQIEMGICP